MRLLAVLLIVAACSRERAKEPRTISPADPQPSRTSTTQADERRMVTTTGSVPPQEQAAPGTEIVRIRDGRIEARPRIPRGHTAFRIINDSTSSHIIELQGTGSRVTVSPKTTAVVQALLTGPSYELVCVAPGHSERARIETDSPGR